MKKFLEKYQKLLIFLLLIIIPLTFISIKSIRNNKKEVNTQDEASPKKDLTLIIDFGEGKISTYSGIPVVNQTALSILEETTKEKNLTLELKKYDFGTLVTKIGSQTNTNEKAWIYFVNGQSPSMGADKNILKNGDIVEWKYIKPSF